MPPPLPRPASGLHLALCLTLASPGPSRGVLRKHAKRPNLYQGLNPTSDPRLTLAMAAGFCASRYSVQVSTLPVVSCPATSIDSRSSRSCFALTCAEHGSPLSPML